MGIRRAKGFHGKACAVGRAEHAGADRIGPQDAGAVGRPEPRGEGARCMDRQSRIADTSQLEFSVVHRGDVTSGVGCYSIMASDLGGQTMTALMNREYRLHATAGPRPAP